MLLSFCPDEQLCWTVLVIKLALCIHFGIILTAQFGTEMTSNFNQAKGHLDY